MNQREVVRALIEPYCKNGQLQGNCAALVSDIDDLLKDSRLQDNAKQLLAGLDMALRQAVAPEYQNKIRQMFNFALTAIRKEEREAAFKEAVEAINAVPMSRYWSDSGEEIARLFRAQALRRVEAAATAKGENDGTPK